MLVVCVRFAQGRRIIAPKWYGSRTARVANSALRITTRMTRPSRAPTTSAQLYRERKRFELFVT
jgi:hypothetical protein